MSRPAPDSGLQPQRTQLAWRRTLLTLAVGSLVAFRVLPGQVGPAAYVLASAGVLTAAALAVVSYRRSKLVDDALATGTALPGAGALLVLSAVVALVAVVCVGALLVLRR